nr:altered inheritance of mitochondria protein 32 [Quercus suber]
MFVFRHGPRRLLSQTVSTVHTSNASLRRSYASRIDVPLTPPPVPIVETCPSPTCQCRDMPAGLDIEREQDISASMPTYAEQVLICTGKEDWASNIEDEADGLLVKELKNMLSLKGKFRDPYHKVLLTNSSFPPTPSHEHSKQEASSPPSSAFLLPSFTCVPNIPTDPASVETFAKAFLLPSQLHKTHDTLSREEQNTLLREPERQARFTGARPIQEILILICGHGGRDSRCGTLGPILKSEFEDKLQRQNIPLIHSAPVAEGHEVNTEVEGYTPTARVGLISHIGGHKWAGNVIVYIPPSFTGNALAGKGIWYGRVGPADCEGIVQKTVVEGKVVMDRLRGVIDQKEGLVRW